MDLPLRDKHHHTHPGSYSKVSNWLISFQKKSPTFGQLHNLLVSKGECFLYKQVGKIPSTWPGKKFIEGKIPLTRWKNLTPASTNHQLHSLWLGYRRGDQERLKTQICLKEGNEDKCVEKGLLPHILLHEASMMKVKARGDSFWRATTSTEAAFDWVHPWGHR